MEVSMAMHITMATSRCQTASHIIAECKYCNGACNGDLHACPGCRIPSCNTISSAQAPQVNMARRREQPCLWLVAPCDVRARRTERKVVSRGGGFYSRRGHPIYSIESMGSNQGGVPLTPPKELIIHSPSFILPTHNPVLKRTPNWVLPVKSREILSTVACL